MVLWLKIGHVRPTCQASRPCYLAERPSLVTTLPFPHWILLLPTYFDMWGRLDPLESAGPGHCATSSLHAILSINTPGFGHN
jgi:hypothetical protein